MGQDARADPARVMEARGGNGSGNGNGTGMGGSGEVSAPEAEGTFSAIQDRS